MAWDPNPQKRFVSRKFKFALDENYHLDKIRGEKKEKRKLTLNVWTTLAASLIILVIAFTLPRLAQAVVTRRHTDALVTLEKTVSSMRQAEMSTNPADNTLFVIEQGGRYFLFWYRQGAQILTKDGEVDTAPYTDLVEISNPEADFPMPINVAEGEKIAYPFTSEPITKAGGKIVMADGLQLLSGYELTEYKASDELTKMLKSNVKLYSVKIK